MCTVGCRLVVDVMSIANARLVGDETRRGWHCTVRSMRRSIRIWNMDAKRNGVDDDDDG